jgi:hypothetical protein
LISLPDGAARPRRRRETSPLPPAGSNTFEQRIDALPAPGERAEDLLFGFGCE